MGQAKYQRDGDPRTSGPGFGLTIHPSVLDLPLRWAKPRLIFMNSMSDLFHANVPTEFIAKVWAVMALTPQHTYQCLTKRHGRLMAIFDDDEEMFRFDFVYPAIRALAAERPKLILDLSPGQDGPFTWPLPNVHVGVSAEDAKWAGIRIPALEKVEAIVRWVSLEPLLGPIDLTPWLSRLDWVVVGGESGPNHRQMDLAWLESIVSQCLDAGVPIHVKQDSGPRSGTQGRISDELWALKQFPAEGSSA